MNRNLRMIAQQIQGSKDPKMCTKASNAVNIDKDRTIKIRITSEKVDVSWGITVSVVMKIDL